MLPARVPFLITLILLSATLAILHALQPPEMLVAMPAASLPVASSGCEKWRLPELLDENWSQVDFGSACASHEKCWSTAGSSWASCNRDYHEDLRAACVRAVKTDGTHAVKNVAVSASEDVSPTLALCFDIASQFYARVQRPAALKRFQTAQAAAESEAIVQAHPDLMQEPLAGEGAVRDIAADVQDALKPDADASDAASTAPAMACSRGRC